MPADWSQDTQLTHNSAANSNICVPGQNPRILILTIGGWHTCTTAIVQGLRMNAKNLDFKSQMMFSANGAGRALELRERSYRG